ncbi:hypothetical protein MW290_22140 [Aquincola tertiaricarbonis]|uniref:Uncharacterized protein n=1 Tax=Aquincola tertiaricarbonis TaxID=391953 RepID=A0ABY4SI81_AQUTE|nr:hypothetical protein [Aquincola tertiaricarbonis]URI11637.1 hypothetical protein MW290_22140 [Aquincola tertiaricarbonis]
MGTVSSKDFSNYSKPMLRVALRFAVALIGLALATVFLVLAVRNGDWFGYAKAGFTALVTCWLFSSLRHGSTAEADGAVSSGPNTNAERIALGLAIGFVAPLVLFWLLHALLVR